MADVGISRPPRGSSNGRWLMGITGRASWRQLCSRRTWRARLSDHGGMFSPAWDCRHRSPTVPKSPEPPAVVPDLHQRRGTHHRPATSHGPRLRRGQARCARRLRRPLTSPAARGRRLCGVGPWSPVIPVKLVPKLAGGDTGSWQISAPMWRGQGDGIWPMGFLAVEVALLASNVACEAER